MSVPQLDFGSGFDDVIADLGDRELKRVAGARDVGELRHQITKYVRVALRVVELDDDRFGRLRFEFDVEQFVTGQARLRLRSYRERRGRRSRRSWNR